EVTEVLQVDGEVDVVHHDLFGHLQDNRREIQNAGDAGLDELVGDFLRDHGRDREDSHARAAVADKSGQLFHSVDRLRHGLFTFAIRVHIECGDNFKTLL